MSVTLADLTDALRYSRRHFLKHIDGVSGDAWTWKPYVECKSLAEMLAHLIVDDRSALESMKTGQFPDFDSHAPTETNPEKLMALLAQTHEELIGYIAASFAESALDDSVTIWGSPMKLAVGIPSLCSEDHYHAGQVAFIRMAMDPSWDYYATVYGMPSA